MRLEATYRRKEDKKAVLFLTNNTAFYQTIIRDFAYDFFVSAVLSVDLSAFFDVFAAFVLQQSLSLHLSPPANAVPKLRAAIAATASNERKFFIDRFSFVIVKQTVTTLANIQTSW
jgi:hypothetical protein